ncbi:hypothetical protein NL676_004646 [Syzygium grande]|nr:hypothetical protein NL676_004646 [Syzygium grande]
MSLPAFPTVAAPTKLHQPPQPPKPTHAATRHGLSFDRPARSLDPTVSWTASIARCARDGRLAEAAGVFSEMMWSGVEPNHVTIVTLLSGCAGFPSGSGFLGASLHGYARKLGLVAENVMVATAVLNMYAKMDRVESARMVFDGMGVRNSVTWNTMIDGYVKKGEMREAIDLFDKMPHRDAVTWTVLINGFVKTGHFDKALELFREMQLSGVRPDFVTVIGAISACANLATLGLGLWIHRFVMKQDFKENIRVCNSLMDMYSRCGCIEYAHLIFEKMPNRTLVSWNTIIAGFAANGHAEMALELFNKMQEEGFKPDGVSFTGAITACSHARLVDEGLGYFHIMKNVHRIEPRIEHYGCLVDLYSRAGRLEDALNVIENMPMKPNDVVLGSLLAACRTREDVKLAERLAKYAVDPDPDSDSNYVLLANIYAADRSWDGANKIRRKMKMLGIQKTPGFSSIEIGSINHDFVAGDKSHPEAECIYQVLDLLSSDMKVWYAPPIIAKELYEND